MSVVFTKGLKIWPSLRPPLEKADEFNRLVALTDKVNSKLRKLDGAENDLHPGENKVSVKGFEVDGYPLDATLNAQHHQLECV